MQKWFYETGTGTKGCNSDQTKKNIANRDRYIQITAKRICGITAVRFAEQIRAAAYQDRQWQRDSNVLEFWPANELDVLLRALQTERRYISI